MSTHIWPGNCQHQLHDGKPLPCSYVNSCLLNKMPTWLALIHNPVTQAALATFSVEWFSGNCKAKGIKNLGKDTKILSTPSKNTQVLMNKDLNLATWLNECKWGAPCTWTLIKGPDSYYGLTRVLSSQLRHVVLTFQDEDLTCCVWGQTVVVDTALPMLVLIFSFLPEFL